MDDHKFFAIALEEARKGFRVGGLPIGACLVSKDAEVLGQGYNRRVQDGSVTQHGEMSALEASSPGTGLPPHAEVYKGATMYSTLLPCVMCTGACLLYGIGRVVYGSGADQNLKYDTAKILQSYGVEVVCLDNKVSEEMMTKWIEENPERYEREPWAD
ncbi:cytosine deaminase [Teratosphaeriaceae sp. CCFEE 6253]|nr:cytosine deaminase [Teratosphaeriaceae sp. CCFEE 6253]